MFENWEVEKPQDHRGPQHFHCTTQTQFMGPFSSLEILHFLSFLFLLNEILHFQLLYESLPLLGSRLNSMLVCRHSCLLPCLLEPRQPRNPRSKSRWDHSIVVKWSQLYSNVWRFTESWHFCFIGSVLFRTTKKPLNSYSCLGPLRQHQSIHISADSAHLYRIFHHYCSYSRKVFS